MNLIKTLPILICLTACTGQRFIDVAADAEVQWLPPHPTQADAAPADPLPVASPPQCGIAIALDECCNRALPYPQSDIDADPCLAPWPAFPIPVDCPPENFPMCNDDCATLLQPISLTVAFNGTTCEFVDECKTDDDCVPARDHSECCPSFEPLPLTWVTDQACILAEGDQTTSLEDCAASPNCASVKCAPPDWQDIKATCQNSKGRGQDLKRCAAANACARLSYCDCITRDDCQAQTGTCFCPSDIDCPDSPTNDTVCKCSGGPYLGCTDAQT